MHKELQELQKNNPDIKIEEIDKKYIISKAWNDDSFVLAIQKDKQIPSLKKIFLLEEFSSFLDLENNVWEFIYSPEKKDSPIVQRNFEFIFEGRTYKCFFSKSSKLLKFFAESLFLTSESQTVYRNLRDFRDYFQEEKPLYIKEYYKDKIPYSFFVKGDLNRIKNKVTFAKTLNFYLHYYDRKSPYIAIYNTNTTKIKNKLPCYTVCDNFPDNINASLIDGTLLDILSVAHITTDVRLKFIFYYQILEYVAYYYLENNNDSKLKQILKNPDINLNADSYVKEIIEVLYERVINKTHDKDKLGKVVKNFCNIKDIELELKENKEAFSKETKFEGGLKINELFNDIEAINSSGNNLIAPIMDNISKIRNVIVHLRETREHISILPTETNNQLIMPYLYLLRRIAEKVVIQFE